MVGLGEGEAQAQLR